MQDNKTYFKVACTDDSLYFGVRCEDSDMGNLNIEAEKDGDTNIWNGDTVEIMLEPPDHAYYQIVVSPAAAVVDLDWKDGYNTNWSSGAQAATRVSEDFWSVEVRIPLAGEGHDRVQPDRSVSGNAPSEEAPWFFNVCRARVREDGRQSSASAFSPTGSNFLASEKFAKLIAR